MKRYYRVMLGKKCMYAQQCYEGNFIGVDYGINEDLTGNLPDEWRDFNAMFIPKYLTNRPHKSKIAAGLACGTIWTLAKGMINGDLILCPNGEGKYRVAEVVGDYYHSPGSILQHRRPVKWLDVMIDKSNLSSEFQASLSATGTIVAINAPSYVTEIDHWLTGKAPSPPGLTEGEIDDVGSFAMEKHLEDFLVANWAQTELGKGYDIYEEEGEIAGKQYPTDTGPIDILAISKDKKELLVVELKRARASDSVVGQILRYMGFVKSELAEEDQVVRGIIIALDDDKRIRRALSVAPNIDFYRYQISFKLVK